MKLLMITGLGSAKDLASGKKGAFYNTLEEFHKYWDRIDIVSPRIENFEIENSLKIVNCKLKIFENVYIHISPWPLILHPIWFLKKGLEIYRKQKFDLMTVQEFPPFYNGIGARLLWHKIKVPYILEIHHIPGYPKSANFKECLYARPILWRLYWKIFGSKAKAVRVVNQKQTPEFLIKAGVPKEKITYISSMYIDLDIFKPMNLPKQYDLIFVGRLAENKGINLLIEAIKNIKYQISNVKCLVVGDGPLRKNLSLEISRLSLQDNVLLYGWANDSGEVAELMNKSKILVMPSYNEGGPRVVLEAMACGVPVLATPVGIVSDVVKNGDSGGIIRWDSDDIASKAKELLNNHELYEKYGKRSVEIAGGFEKRAAIKNYAEKLKQLI